MPVAGIVHDRVRLGSCIQACTTMCHRALRNPLRLGFTTHVNVQHLWQCQQPQGLHSRLQTFHLEKQNDTISATDVAASSENRYGYDCFFRAASLQGLVPSLLICLYSTLL